MANDTILLERVYDDTHQKRYRVLVDRLWPRGVSKEHAALDEWCKELAPSAALRKWFGHKPERWVEFQKKYEHELKGCGIAAHALLRRAGRKKLVLLFRPWRRRRPRRLRRWRWPARKVWCSGT